MPDSKFIWKAEDDSGVVEVSMLGLRAKESVITLAHEFFAVISIKRLGPEQICNGNGSGRKVHLDQSPLDKQCSQTELAVAQPL